MSAAGIAEIVSHSIHPVLTELNRQSDERLAQLVQEANTKIRQLETEIKELKASGQSTRSKEKNIMEFKAFQKIDRFREGYGKWKTFREQVENLVELGFPRAGRATLRWAKNMGMHAIEWDDVAMEYNHKPPVDHEIANQISEDLYVALSYLVDGEAESIKNNAGEGNGVEAWRRLQQRFDPKSKARDLVDSQKIIRPAQC